jgi:DNA replication ATP-dependent helicase Dna2
VPSTQEPGMPIGQDVEDELPDSALSPEARMLRKLRREVAREAEEGRREAARDWAKPLDRRLEEGLAIAGAWCVHKGDGWIEVDCPGQKSRFRKGDLVRVGFGNPLTERAVTAFVEEDAPDNLMLFASLREQAEYAAELESLPGERILDVGVMDLSATVLGALQQISETRRGQKVVLPLLMGTLKPKLDQEAYHKALAWGEAAGLNWTQCEALAQGYATDLCALVQGPPGTGKTRVLAELAGLLAQAGKRVLVTSLTHRAIGNALVAVAKRWGGMVPCAKFGGSSAEHPQVFYFDEWKQCPWKRFNDGFVAGATPFAAAGTRLDGAEFDVVLIDEASQLTVPNACMALIRADKFVLFGDHRQLPPVMRTLSGPELPKASIFGLLAGRGYSTMLTETWRLGPVLADWPSRHFYGGALEPNLGIAHEHLELVRPPERFQEVLDPAFPRVFCRVRHGGSRRRSEVEAVVVADLVAELLRCGISPKEIAVIAPFRAQANAIRIAMQERDTDRIPSRDLVIDTVERMQGQERDVVIVSLTTSDPAWATRLAEFYFQPERLNVAVTRARRKLVLVGSERVLEAFPMDERLQAGVALLRSLLEESKVVDADS